jgi:hypothetical protein
VRTGEASFLYPFKPPGALSVWSDAATAVPKPELSGEQLPRLFHPQGLLKYKNHD